MNLIKQDYLILIVFLFSFFGLHAQTDFRPGYIIEISGDTLLGEIDYRGDRLMSKICKFKDRKNTINEYSPNEIFGFRFIDSKYYVSKKLDSKNVFLEYLLEGQVSLFYMRDNQGDHYYLDKENVGLKEIPFNEGTKKIGDKNFRYESTKHRGILKHYMQDAPKLQSRIMSFAEPKHTNMVRLVEDYHNAVCDDECIIYEKKSPLLQVKLELLAGTLYFRDNPADNFASEFQAGFLTHFKLARSNEKLYLRTGYIQTAVDTGDLEKNVYKIPIQFEYIYSKGNLKPKFAGGVTVYNPIGISISFMGGANIKIYKSLHLSLNYEIDFEPNQTVFILPGRFFTHGFTAGILFDL